MSEIDPDLHTSMEDYSGAEKAKLSTRGLSLAIQDVSSPANLKHQFKDSSFQELADVAETLAKSYGIYLDFDRAKTGQEKDWMYMLRITIPGGGPMTQRQWAILDDVAEKYTGSDLYTGKVQSSLRVTTRQNIQLHWIKKKDVIDAVSEIARSGFYTINGCGDNVRNVMGCPLSHYTKVFDASAWSQKAGAYFRLPTAAYIEIFEIDPKYLRDDRAPEQRFQYGPNLLNRKFKIAFSSIHHDENTGKFLRDNCVEVGTNDLGIVPILDGEKVERFQIYVGGGQGQKTGHPTFATLGKPLGIVGEDGLLEALDAVVKVHQEWGDRKNRHWARLKYVVYKMGIEWYRARVEETGVKLAPADEALDYGPRQLHHGWTRQESDGKMCYGMFLENGRVIDGPDGQLKTMVRRMTESYPAALVYATPNQDLLFAGIDESEMRAFESELTGYGYGVRNGKPYSALRLHSGACVGRETCRLTYTDSELFEPHLIDELEAAWGHASESIGITGCERQCFRPATKTIGWVGAGFNIYSLKVGGTEDGRHQGGALVDPQTNEIYLHLVPRKEVPKVTSSLFAFHLAHARPEEAVPGGLGYFLRRVGSAGIIEWLKNDPSTAQLMKRTTKNQLLPQDRELVNPSLLKDGEHIPDNIGKDTKAP